MTSEQWLEKIRQIEGSDAEIIIGIHKNDNIDLSVHCKVEMMIEFVKEMGTMVHDAKPDPLYSGQRPRLVEGRLN